MVNDAVKKEKTAKKEKAETKSQVEKIYTLLEYLKWNTDKEHKVRQKDLKKVEEVKDVLGVKDTFGRNIERISKILNMNADETLKNPEEWELIYDRFLIENGYLEGEELEEEDEELDEDTPLQIGDIYYRHPFSYEDVNQIIEGLLFLDTIDSKECEQLIKKIEKKLTTKYFKKAHKVVNRIYKPAINSHEELHEKLYLIQKAIREQVQIEFVFQGYNRDKKLVDNRKKTYFLCPYYIVANSGKYYLIGCYMNEHVVQHNMSIWRIDLMRDIQIPDRNKSRKGRPSVEKHKVNNLPIQWDEQFLLSHVNMSYDQPKTITLKIKSPKEMGNPNKAMAADYTFMHDYFGDTFRYIETEAEAPYDDIVKVRCSPYGMVNWALQYSDRVEVIAPEDVRNMVAEKVKRLAMQYESK